MHIHSGNPNPGPKDTEFADAFAFDGGLGQLAPLVIFGSHHIL